MTVVNPSPGGGTSNGLSFTISNAPNPVPGISSLSPPSVVRGRAGITLTVNGNNFVASSVVLADGAARPTTFVDSTQLQAVLPPEDLSVAGTIDITVSTPGPGGGTSTSLSFTVENPLPTITELDPSSVPAGSPDFTATVTGTGFVPGSVIRTEGVDRATIFVSPTRLRTPVPASEVAVAVPSVTVTVFNPGPGGGESNPLLFSVTDTDAPAPVLTSVTPDSATAGREGLRVTLNGSDFSFNSVARWNGSDRPTVFVSGTELQAWLPVSDLALAGTASLTVFTPSPGGGESSPVTFTVNNPVPQIVGLSPSGALTGSGGFTLSVGGSGFVPGSEVRWEGVGKPTTFVSNNELRADISASDVPATDSSVSVTVFNANPGGGLSNALAFFVVSSHDAPTISSLSPSSAPEGREGLTLVVNGTGFSFASVVRWNGADRVTSFVSPTELRAVIPASDLEAAGTFSVEVFNPSPGGGTASTPFTVTP